MAGGFFQPYSGVGTAVLIFVKGGKTEKVWFYDMGADGYTVDLKREFVDGKGDIPDVVTKFRKGRIESAQSILVPLETIRRNGYNLSSSQYKKAQHKTREHGDPGVLLDRVAEIEEEITKELQGLKKMI